MHRVDIVDPEHDPSPCLAPGRRLRVELEVEVAGADPERREAGARTSDDEAEAERLVEGDGRTHVGRHERHRADALDRSPRALHRRQPCRPTRPTFPDRFAGCELDVARACSYSGEKPEGSRCDNPIGRGEPSPPRRLPVPFSPAMAAPDWVNRRAARSRPQGGTSSSAKRATGSPPEVSTRVRSTTCSTRRTSRRSNAASRAVSSCGRISTATTWRSRSSRHQRRRRRLLRRADPQDAALGGHITAGQRLTGVLRSHALPHDNWLAQVAPVPYDQIIGVGREIEGLEPRTHRVQTFGHDRRAPAATRRGGRRRTRGCAGPR